jgi:hypothetical protein
MNLKGFYYDSVKERYFPLNQAKRCSSPTAQEDLPVQKEKKQDNLVRLLSRRETGMRIFQSTRLIVEIAQTKKTESILSRSDLEVGAHGNGCAESLLGMLPVKKKQKFRRRSKNQRRMRWVNANAT